MLPSWVCLLLSLAGRLTAPARGLLLQDARLSHGPAAGPGDPPSSLEPVSRDGEGRYSSESTLGRELEVSQDQFMYSFPMSTKKYEYGTEFPSAWLMRRDNFLRYTLLPERWGDQSFNIEINVFQPAGYEEIFKNAIPKTLDFFDFMGVHLSFWADEAGVRPSGRYVPGSDASKAKVREYFEGRLSNDIARFQKQASLLEGQNPSRLGRDTVALVPVALTKDREVEGLMFNATFWSLKSQFDAVVLGACKPEDHDFAKQFPAWRVVQLQGLQCEHNGGKPLLSHAMHALGGELPESTEWERFKYVYYTEGDVVLHLREHDRILAHLERAGTRSLVPHRLDTLPAVDDFPQALKGELSEDREYLDRLELYSTPVSMVDLGAASCCFSGRMHLGENFWWEPSQAPRVFPLLRSAKLAAEALPITLASHGAPEVCELSARGSCR